MWWSRWSSAADTKAVCCKPECCQEVQLEGVALWIPRQGRYFLLAVNSSGRAIPWLWLQRLFFCVSQMKDTVYFKNRQSRLFLRQQMCSQKVHMETLWAEGDLDDPTVNKSSVAVRETITTRQLCITP